LCSVRTGVELLRIRQGFVLNSNILGWSYTVVHPPHTFGGNRKDEIQEWMEEDPEVWENFSGLILDDMGPDECDPKLPNLLFYRTDYRFGLTELDVDTIIEKMNKQDR
jgi:hypothetical protein